MKSALVLLAVMGLMALSSAQVFGVVRFEDDGSWKPHLDGSVLGSGALTWLGVDLDDGQWKPHLDNSAAGLVHRLRRAVPLDAPDVALKKHAHLVQLHTEATRNLLGGGVPVALPADTPEVAAGKQAHALVHAHQTALTSGLPLATPLPAGLVSPLTTRFATPLGLPVLHPYTGLHTVW